MTWQSDGAVLWVGSDGSTRRYASVATRGDTTVFAAPQVTRPDSLYRRTTSGAWRRALRGGANTYFDALGRHVQTTNREQRSTVFTYDATAGRGRLASITVPGNQTDTLQYTTSGVTITAPGARTTRLDFAVQPNTVSRITDPDGGFVRFTYTSWGPALAIASRVDRQGATTNFAWTSYASTVDSAWTPVSGSQTVVQHVVSPTGRGAFRASGVAVGADQPDYVLDGPRTDVADVTQLWVDTLGAPRRIVDALGQVTTITRGDARFGGLVTSVLQPNGFTTTTDYDSAGHVLHQTALSPYGDSRNATTTYAWSTSVGTAKSAASSGTSGTGSLRRPTS